jgi:hypothetical protein
MYALPPLMPFADFVEHYIHRANPLPLMPGLWPPSEMVFDRLSAGTYPDTGLMTHLRACDAVDLVLAVHHRLASIDAASLSNGGPLLDDDAQLLMVLFLVEMHTAVPGLDNPVLLRFPIDIHLA